MKSVGIWMELDTITFSPRKTNSMCYFSHVGANFCIIRLCVFKLQCPQKSGNLIRGHGRQISRELTRMQVVYKGKRINETRSVQLRWGSRKRSDYREGLLTLKNF